MIKYILMIAGILTLPILYAWYEYTWADRIIEKHNNNWTVINKEYTWTIYKPWTWYKQPVSTILLLENGIYGKLNDQYYFAHTKIFNRGKESFGGINIIDIKNSKFSTCSSLKEFKELNDEILKGLNWLDYTRKSPIYHISEFLKKNVKTYVMNDPIGDEIDITNYILNGKYSIKENSGKFVWSLTNHNPYSLTKEDISLVQKSLAYWYKNHPKFSKSNIASSKNQIKYLYSQMFHKITDIYSFTLNSNYSNKDTILNLEFTFSQLYYPDKKSENRVVFLDSE